MRYIIVILFFILALIVSDAKGVERIGLSLFLDGWTTHMPRAGANEHPKTVGTCYYQYCYVSFVNSCFKHSDTVFYQHDYYRHGFFKVGGRYGLITGYTPSPGLVLMPYVGLGIGSMWLEFTYFPLAHGYIFISMLKLEF
jgi:hypothetical protein